MLQFLTLQCVLYDLGCFRLLLLSVFGFFFVFGFVFLFALLCFVMLRVASRCFALLRFTLALRFFAFLLSVAFLVLALQCLSNCSLRARGHMTILFARMYHKKTHDIRSIAARICFIYVALILCSVSNAVPRTCMSLFSQRFRI